MLNRWGATGLCLVAVLFYTPAIAGEINITSGAHRTPVVELYTSEGCSSCPPADQWVSKLGDALGGDFHAVPLAFHVDYWNYLGWEDPFSRAEYTTRQRELAANNRQRSIYTPEFAVSGRETRGTSAVVEAIQSANAELAEVMIEMNLMAEGEREIAATLTINSVSEDAELYLAVYENDIKREIGGGENHGRTLHHDFVVRHWVRATSLPVGPYQGAHSVSLDQKWNLQNLGLAAVVVDRPSGKTLQAVSTPLTALFTGTEGS
ncbi:MAG: DUF1223 domain-containing protein [Gammaproteobacteria bacterium]